MNSADYTKKVLGLLSEADLSQTVVKNFTVAGQVPSTLAQGEIAVNIIDKKLWIGNVLNIPVLFINSVAAPAAVGLNTEVLFNDSGVIGAHAGLTYNKTTSTLTVTNLTGLTNITGNAGTATQLLSYRNIALGGDVTGNVNFNGSGNVTINTSIPTIDGGSF
jgi:hypothetical protein